MPRRPDLTLKIEALVDGEWQELLGHDCQSDEELRLYVAHFDPEEKMLRAVALQPGDTVTRFVEP